MEKQKKYKQIFIEIPNIFKKIKKIHDYLQYKTKDTYIIHEYGKMMVLVNNIIDVTNIPIDCYKKTIQFKENEEDVYVNTYLEKKDKNVFNIPEKHKLLKTEKSIYKLSEKSCVEFIIEKHIEIDENTDIYDLDFNDKNNIIHSEYYFKLNDADENSYFVKEELFSFLHYLN